MDQPRNILLVGFHYPHHTAISGYDCIRHHINSTYLDGGILPFSGNDLLSRAMHRIFFESVAWYKERRFQIVHALYADAHVSLSLKPLSEAIRVATVHNSIEYSTSKTNGIIKWLRNRRFRKLSGIIVLSSGERNAAESIFPDVDTRFIPHGIEDIMRIYNFCIEPMDNNIIRIVVVGNNHRDFYALSELVKFALAERKHWRFELIGVGSACPDIIRNSPNVTIHARLSDIDYFRTLSRSHVHFLPLRFATANNALLEAHAVGTVSVVTAHAGAGDYAVETTCLYRSFSELVSYIDQISNMNAFQMFNIRSKTANESRRFLWSNVARDTQAFYDYLWERSD